MDCPFKETIFRVVTVRRLSKALPLIKRDSILSASRQVKQKSFFLKSSAFTRLIRTMLAQSSTPHVGLVTLMLSMKETINMRKLSSIDDNLQMEKFYFFENEFSFFFRFSLMPMKFIASHYSSFA